MKKPMFHPEVFELDEEELGFGADYDDPRQYCRHGTFIGSWWGPDYLCPWCESGEEPPEDQKPV